ncbi:MAG: ATP-binding protein [Egibacteraceae bacterium]
MVVERGGFVGRKRQLGLLERELAEVRGSGMGRFVLLRGRRRVGKSRLVSEFLVREQTPSVFFAATPGPPDRELARFAEAVERSTLPASTLVRGGTTFNSWEGALSTIALAADRDPCVVVIDELPYLIDGRPEVEAELQHVWDQVLERRPVLLVAIGSDLAVMNALTTYGRPLYGRPTREIVLEPLTVAEIGELLRLDPADAIDAALVVGGFPLVAQSWSRGLDRRGFLEEALNDSTSALIVSAERALNAESPDPSARAVLTAVGAGETTFTAIGSRAGVSQTTLRRTLDALLRRRVVMAERPLSARPATKLTRFRVADPYLRFWLRFVEPGLDEIERGRGDLAVQRVEQGWLAYRGVAVEPLVRGALDRLLPDARFGDARQVGAFWTRSGEVEVDLVGMSAAPPTAHVAFVGSIKWREQAPFDRADLAALHRGRQQVPGTDSGTLLVAVSRAGIEARGLDVRLGPADIVAAWQERP